MVEKFTRVFRSGFFREAFLYLVFNILVAAVPFILLPIYTNKLTPADYGLFSIFVAGTNFIFPVVALGTSAAASRKYFDREGIEFQAFFACCLLVCLGMTFVAAIVAIPFLKYLSALTHLSGAWLMAMALTALSQAITSNAAVLMTMQKRPWMYGVLRLCQALAIGGIGVWLVLGRSMAWEGAAYGHMWGNFAAATTGLIVLWRSRLLGKRICWKYFKEIFLFGLPLVPHAMAAMTFTFADRLFLTNMVGAKYTGIYVAGFQISMVIYLLMNSANQAWIPWIYGHLKSNNSHSQKKIVMATYLGILGFLAATGLFIFVAPALVDLLVGKEFKDASAVVPWISIGFFWVACYAMVTPYLYYLRRTSELAIIGVISSFANMGLNYVLISYNGWVGAAQATCIAYFISAVLTGVVAVRLYPMPWNMFKGYEATR
jgi:O-antigen/teichoic acid export membrane protein